MKTNRKLRSHCTLQHLFSWFIYLFFSYILISWFSAWMQPDYKEHSNTASVLFHSQLADYEKEISNAVHLETRKNLTIQQRILGVPPQALNLSYISVQKNVKGFIVIDQNQEDKEIRRQIRAGWANKTNSEGLRNGSISIMFLVGKRNNSVSPELMKESIKFGDIFIADVEETTGNLVYKLMVAYKWITSFYMNSFVVKIDKHTLENFISDQTEEKWILGKIIEGGPADRNDDSSDFISKESYPYDQLPEYADSSLYIISPFALTGIFSIIHGVKAPRPENIFYAGILAFSAKVSIKSDERIFDKVSSCTEISPNTLAFSAKNSKLGPLKEYESFMKAKKGKCQ